MDCGSTNKNREDVMQTIHKKVHYEIRYWPNDFGYSKRIGMHLIPNRKTANKVGNWFKKRGINVFTVAVVLNVPNNKQKRGI